VQAPTDHRQERVNGRHSTKTRWDGDVCVSKVSQGQPEADNGLGGDRLNRSGARCAYGRPDMGFHQFR
jgi:hypothetical protein